MTSTPEPTPSGGHTNRDFNPSNDERVDAIKEAAEALANAVALNAVDGPLKDKALIDTQSASMFAVKSIFS
jgi:hypothetical protein